MSYAYNEAYYPLAQNRLGDAFDYAVNSLKIQLSEFVKMFIVSGMAHQFEIANPTYVAGMNGCEVAKEVLASCGLDHWDSEDVMYLDKSTDDLYGMYLALHEEDVLNFVEIMNQKKSELKVNSMLRRLRTYAGLSQSQLAKRAEVPLRQIQLFEQGQRDISKTQGETLVRLARALNCRVEDII